MGMNDMASEDMALAEKLTLRRARVSIVLGVFFLVTMASSLADKSATNAEARRMDRLGRSIAVPACGWRRCVPGQIGPRADKWRKHHRQSPAGHGGGILGDRPFVLCLICDQPFRADFRARSDQIAAVGSGGRVHHPLRHIGKSIARPWLKSLAICCVMHGRWLVGRRQNSPSA